MEMNPYFAIPTTNSSEVIIEDRYLRKILIDAAIKAEQLLENKQISITDVITSKPNKWGLIVETTMEQPSNNKPVIYKFRYRLDVIIYNEWLKEHSYMLGDEGALVFTSKMGLKIMIMPNMKKHPVVNIIIQYGKNMSDKEHSVELALKSLNFIIHREIINLHDWIVKYAVE